MSPRRIATPATDNFYPCQSSSSNGPGSSPASARSSFAPHIAAAAAGDAHARAGRGFRDMPVPGDVMSGHQPRGGSSHSAPGGGGDGIHRFASTGAELIGSPTASGGSAHERWLAAHPPTAGSGAQAHQQLLQRPQLSSLSSTVAAATEVTLAGSRLPPRHGKGSGQHADPSAPAAAESLHSSVCFRPQSPPKPQPNLQQPQVHQQRSHHRRGASELGSGPGSHITVALSQAPASPGSQPVVGGAAKRSFNEGERASFDDGDSKASIRDHRSRHDSRDKSSSSITSSSTGSSTFVPSHPPLGGRADSALHHLMTRSSPEWSRRDSVPDSIAEEPAKRPPQPQPQPPSRSASQPSPSVPRARGSNSSSSSHRGNGTNCSHSSSAPRSRSASVDSHSSSNDRKSRINRGGDGGAALSRKGKGQPGTSTPPRTRMGGVQVPASLRSGGGGREPATSASATAPRRRRSSSSNASRRSNSQDGSAAGSTDMSNKASSLRGRQQQQQPAPIALSGLPMTSTHSSSARSVSGVGGTSNRNSSSSSRIAGNHGGPKGRWGERLSSPARSANSRTSSATRSRPGASEARPPAPLKASTGGNSNRNSRTSSRAASANSRNSSTGPARAQQLSTGGKTGVTTRPLWQDVVPPPSQHELEGKASRDGSAGHSRTPSGSATSSHFSNRLRWATTENNDKKRSENGGDSREEDNNGSTGLHYGRVNAPSPPQTVLETSGAQYQQYQQQRPRCSQSAVHSNAGGAFALETARRAASPRRFRHDEEPAGSLAAIPAVALEQMLLARGSTGGGGSPGAAAGFSPSQTYGTSRLDLTREEDLKELFRQKYIVDPLLQRRPGKRQFYVEDNIGLMGRFGMWGENRPDLEGQETEGETRDERMQAVSTLQSQQLGQEVEGVLQQAHQSESASEADPAKWDSAYEGRQRGRPAATAAVPRAAAARAPQSRGTSVTSTGSAKQRRPASPTASVTNPSTAATSVTASSQGSRGPAASQRSSARVKSGGHPQLQLQRSPVRARAPQNRTVETMLLRGNGGRGSRAASGGGSRRDAPSSSSAARTRSASADSRASPSDSVRRRDNVNNQTAAADSHYLSRSRRQVGGRFTEEMANLDASGDHDIFGVSQRIQEMVARGRGGDRRGSGSTWSQTSNATAHQRRQPQRMSSEPYESPPERFEKEEIDRDGDDGGDSAEQDARSDGDIFAVHEPFTAGDMHNSDEDSDQEYAEDDGDTDESDEGRRGGNCRGAFRDAPVVSLDAAKLAGALPPPQQITASTNAASASATARGRSPNIIREPARGSAFRPKDHDIFGRRSPASRGVSPFAPTPNAKSTGAAAALSSSSHSKKTPTAAAKAQGCQRPSSRASSARGSRSSSVTNPSQSQQQQNQSRQSPLRQRGRPSGSVSGPRRSPQRQHANVTSPEMRKAFHWR